MIAGLDTRSRVARYVVGVAISLVFVWLTLTRVDLGEVGRALVHVQPELLIVALIAAGLETCIRAWRWQRLLWPIRDVPYAGALAQLCVGYFANSILPARLGDVARAYLAGQAFGLSKMVVFGSILVERLGDGVTILLVVTFLIATLPEAQPLVNVAVPVAALGFGAVGAAGVILALTHRTRLARTGLGRLVRSLFGRVAPALQGLQTTRRAVQFGALTLMAFGAAIVAMWLTASAVGVYVTPLQAALVTGALALSTAIPAAPGSVGTYEFVGVAVLTGLGFPPDASLAIVLLVHLAATLVPASAGLLVVWHAHIRFGSLVDEASPRSAVPRTSSVAASRRAIPRLALILPAYNEADRIEQTIETIARYRARKGVDWPVILADDGSTDDTIEVAESAASSVGLEIRVLRYPHRGKASAVRAGMLELAGDQSLDYLMMLDADDELKIDQLDHVEWTADPRTVYIGRRVGEIGKARSARPRPFRRLMSSAMRLASRVLLGLSFPDTQCGFKLFPRPFAGAIFEQQHSASWVFDAELLVITHRVSGLPVLEVPLTWQPRGESKVTAGAAVTSGLGLLGVAWRYWSGAYVPVAPDASVVGAAEHVGV